MNFLQSVISAFAPNVNAQINAVESEAQTVAQAVAVWGAIVVIELGVVIWLLSRKK
jgi:hypothetical protein